MFHIINTQPLYLLEKFWNILYFVSSRKEIIYHEDATRDEDSNNFFEKNRALRHVNLVKDESAYHQLEFSVLEW